jgi:hypothetical protein
MAAFSSRVEQSPSKCAGTVARLTGTILPQGGGPDSEPAHCESVTVSTRRSRLRPVWQGAACYAYLGEVRLQVDWTLLAMDSRRSRTAGSRAEWRPSAAQRARSAITAAGGSSKLALGPHRLHRFPVLCV